MKFQVPSCYHSNEPYILEANSLEEAQNLVDKWEWEYTCTYNIGSCPLVNIIEIDIEKENCFNQAVISDVLVYQDTELMAMMEDSSVSADTWWNKFVEKHP